VEDIKLASTHMNAVKVYETGNMVGNEGSSHSIRTDPFVRMAFLPRHRSLSSLKNRKCRQEPRSPQHTRSIIHTCSLFTALDTSVPTMQSRLELSIASPSASPPPKRIRMFHARVSKSFVLEEEEGENREETPQTSQNPRYDERLRENASSKECNDRHQCNNPNVSDFSTEGEERSKNP